MYQQKLLFWCAFVFYLINIYSIYIATLLFLQAGTINLNYFIAFSSIFAIDKIVIIIISFCNRKISFKYVICDLFQIGFLYIFFDDDFDFDLKTSLATKTLTRILPQIILEFIFFVCLADQISSSQSIQILIVVNFLLFLGLFSCFMSFIILDISSYYFFQELKKNIYNLLNIILSLMSYYLCISTYVFYEDLLGINLGYYNLVLAFLTILGYIAFKCQKLDQKLIRFTLKYLFLNGCSTNHKFYKISFNSIYLKRANYISQLVRFSILILYCKNDLFNNKSSNKTKQTLTYFTLIIIFLTLIIQFFEFYKSWKIKIIIINKNKDLVLANNQLQKWKYNYILFEIYVDYENNDLKQQLISQTEFHSEVQTFIQLVTKYIRKNKRILLQGSYGQYSNIFYGNPIEILANLEDICDIFYHNLVSNISLNEMINVLSLRLNNGFVFSEITFDLISRISNQNVHFKNMKSLTAFQLQITLFHKRISPIMQFQPSQILYDLYQEN
ncbi:hypothetical protein ABPG74_017610 [Tetrahymena malaccensis]